MKNIKSILIFLLLLVVLSTSAFADSSLNETAEETDVSIKEEWEAVENETDTDLTASDIIKNPTIMETVLVDTFKETEREEFLRIIASGTVNKVTRAGREYYVITDDGNYYFTGSNDDDVTELDTFIKVNGLELKTSGTKNLLSRISSKTGRANGTLSSSSSKSVGNLFSYMFGIGLVFLLIVLAAKRSMESRGVFVASANSDDKVGKSVGDEVKIPTVKFSDVEGVEGLKEDVFRLVDCLKNPDKYDEIGARTPKGVILYGPPGTGKTLLAKAIAGEAGVPFFSAVGSDFVEMYVGVGAKRVRELYRKARKSAPCIVFIDEIDAVASKRGSDNNSEKDQTINALLSELDGFSSKEKIITICATNRLDMLDSAFKRAGRFDLKLAVGLPDKEGRLNILKIHAKNKKLSDEVNLEQVATKCSGFSGAELETLLNEAAMSAVGKGHALIDNDDIEDAFFKIILQGNKKPRKEIDEMNRIVAWHEAGHTLATKLLTDDSVPSVTIVGSSSGAGGVTFRTPKQEGLQSKKYLRALIGVMYAGRAAEELYQGNTELITTGASQDIQQATSIIKEYLAVYGMGELGMLDMTQLRSDFGDIIEEASKLSKEIYDDTLKLLSDNIYRLEKLAEALLEKETLYENEIDSIIAH